MTSENWRVNESGRYLPSGAVGQPPQLVQPAVGSLDGQNRHCHAVGTKHRSLTPYCRILIFLPHSALHHFTTRLIDLFPPTSAEHWRGRPTPDWQRIPPDPGRRWWTTGGFERRCLPPPGSPSPCWPSHLYR